MKRICNHEMHPLHCIIPPYMLDKLIKNKDTKLATLSLHTKIDTEIRRQKRNMIAALSNKELSLLRSGQPKASTTATAKIEIYDAKHTQANPGTKIPNPTTSTDADAKRAYSACKATWSLYYDIFNRNSIDNAGMTLVNTIHFDKKYNNAFWDGTHMTYGDGDGKIFSSFTKDIDIIGHELTHGVTESAGGLDYEFQPGALNESFSDVFGILVKQYALNQDVKKSNWLIGENVVIGKQYALRSMKAPGTAYKNHPFLGNDPQPAVMKDFVKLPATDDHGGVHLNSGIPNFAFYVTAFNIGGNAWEKAGKIWYKALLNKTLLPPKSKFVNAKQATLESAKSLYGNGSLEYKAVKDGWSAAGV